MTEAYHFIGIAGIGMSGIARLLLQQGKQVSGSDISDSLIKDDLRALGAQVYDTHSTQHVSPQYTVIYNTDIPQDHPELLAAREQGCLVLHRSKMLAKLFHTVATPLAVTGTHGKTTTSALLTSVLQMACGEVSYVVGGICFDSESNSGWGKSPYFVIEADESDSSFLEYFPQGAIVTNIDLDHMSHFGDEETLIRAFKTFIQQVQSKELLVWCGDDSRLRELDLPGVSYGFQTDCQVRIIRFRQVGWRTFFDLHWQGQLFSDIEVSLPGKHSVLNATAVFTLALLLGVNEQAIRQGLSQFKGVQRRVEPIASCSTVLVLDDYAHHPLEIQTTLQGIRKAVGYRRLVAVFQPHRYTRLAEWIDTLDEIYRSFEDADEIYLTDLYEAGEKPIPGISTELLFEALVRRFPNKVILEKKEKLVDTLLKIARPLDVFAFLGAGDISLLAHQMGERLRIEPPRPWKIGVICGGPSAEHAVSLKSAQFIRYHLCSETFELQPFWVSKSYQWFEHPVEDSQEMNQSSTVLSDTLLKKIFACDIFFPIMHGTFGEDGVIQGFLDTLAKPYVGCNHRSAAICMDKAIAKKIASYHGLLVPPFIQITESQWKKYPEAIYEQVKQQISYPVVVKPSHLGSSIGISEVRVEQGLKSALEAAFLVDTDVLIEKRLIHVRDIEFAVLGNHEVQVFSPGEIYNEGKLYSYEDKVGSVGPVTTPCAVLSVEQQEKGKKLAHDIYVACGCQGWARVDFLLDQEGNYWFNEVNPIPGCTSISLYPLMCSEGGITPKEPIKQLVSCALARHRQNQSKHLSFKHG